MSSLRSRAALGIGCAPQGPVPERAALAFFRRRFAVDASSLARARRAASARSIAGRLAVGEPATSRRLISASVVASSSPRNCAANEPLMSAEVAGVSKDGWLLFPAAAAAEGLWLGAGAMAAVVPAPTEAPAGAPGDEVGARIAAGAAPAGAAPAAGAAEEPLPAVMTGPLAVD